MRTLTLAAFCLLSVIDFGCGKTTEKATVSRFTVYYLPWSLDTYAALSCDDVLESDDSVTVDDRSQIDRFLALVDDLALVEISGLENIDARVCIVYWTTNEDAPERISLGPPNAMQFEGRVYALDQRLLDFVVGYLPANYLEAN